MTRCLRYALVLMTAVVAAGFTMADNKQPPVTGPSEMSLSLAISANSDVLSLDGASQSLISIEAATSTGSRRRCAPPH